MRGAKLITINCNHCNRKIHATIKQFLEGMECPACGMPITPGNEDQINSTNSFMSKTTCANCKTVFDISIADSFKHLAVCPKCNALFVRDNLMMEDLVGESGDESFMLLEQLYPSIPNDQNSDMSDVAAASPTELKFLAELNVKANNPTSRVVQRVVKTILNEVNVAVVARFNSMLYFPPNLRSKVYMAVAKSPLFRSLYFDQEMPKEELDNIVRSSLGDDELYRALGTNFDKASYEIAVVYIRTFAKLIYEKDLDDATARIMALRAFARGWGSRIRHAGYFVYSQEDGKVRNITRLSMSAMKSFYTRKSAVNNGIDAMLAEAGWQRPPGGGCLGIIIAGVVAMWWVWC